MISEWNLLIVRYWAKAGEINRMRLRLRLRIRMANKHLNEMEQLFTQFSS
jgi:hypothetical protein